MGNPGTRCVLPGLTDFISRRDSDEAGSWVAKWQRISDYTPGMYAVKVVGTLPDEVVAALEDAGVGYVRRDGGAEGDEGRGEE